MSEFVIFPGMQRKVNSVIIQRYNTTCLVNEPQKAYSIEVGLWITTINACIFCRTDFVVNRMTNEKPVLGPQSLICSIKPRKYLSSVLSV